MLRVFRRGPGGAACSGRRTRYRPSDGAGSDGDRTRATPCRTRIACVSRKNSRSIVPVCSIRPTDSSILTRRFSSTTPLQSNRNSSSRPCFVEIRVASVGFRIRTCRPCRSTAFAFARSGIPRAGCSMGRNCSSPMRRMPRLASFTRTAKRFPVSAMACRRSWWRPIEPDFSAGAPGRPSLSAATPWN